MELLELLEQARTNMEKANFAYKGYSKDYSECERDYRIALAKKILILKGEGFAATIINDLAKGDEVVAGLKQKRDLASGLMQSSLSAIYNYRLEYKTLHENYKIDVAYQG